MAEFERNLSDESTLKTKQKPEQQISCQKSTTSNDSDNNRCLSSSPVGGCSETTLKRPILLPVTRHPLMTDADGDRVAFDDDDLNDENDEEIYNGDENDCPPPEADPEVETELEILNSAATEINSLELKLDGARGHFQKLHEEATLAIRQLKAKLGRCVGKARPFYEAKSEAKQAQQATQEAARKFRRAISLYDAAKETISLAEDRFQSVDTREFDSAWQQALSNATVRLFEAECEKSWSEEEHRHQMGRLAEVEIKVNLLQKQETKNIAKARIYFETKAMYEENLLKMKRTIEELQTSIASAKTRYRKSLLNLERISEQRHLQKNLNNFKYDLVSDGDSHDSLDAILRLSIGSGSTCTSRSDSISMQSWQSDLDLESPSGGGSKPDCDGNGGAAGASSILQAIDQLQLTTGCDSISQYSQDSGVIADAGGSTVGGDKTAIPTLEIVHEHESHLVGATGTTGPADIVQTETTPEK
ncbi:uncharacterized protein LOC141912295 [Tubulanus polymorphus]|uniref:uncharacterized protein LOC141912295 n=1 Tax=Tubulanus polymorphus TaxID=672921 RepID=UPI003DA42FE9